jgi:hypothetical protein
MPLRAALTALLYTAFAVTYNTADSDLYLIPVWALSAGYLGVGLASALERSTRRAGRWVLGATAALTVALMLLAGWPTHDLSQDRVAAEFAEDTLAAAPPNALLVTHEDAYTFTLWYYRQVVAWRPDVSIVDARLAGYAWYEPMLSAQGAAPHLPDDVRRPGLAQRLASANPGRPVCEVFQPLLDDNSLILQCD